MSPQTAETRKANLQQADATFTYVLRQHHSSNYGNAGWYSGRLQRRIEDAKKSVAVLEKDERSNTTTTTKGDDEEHTNFIPLKPFGLCCYKTDPEIWEESDEAENARTAAMIDGAYAFLRSLEVIHPDYEFFSHHG